MSISLIQNEESASSIRSKLNETITKVNNLKEFDIISPTTNGILVYDGEKFKTTENTIDEHGNITFNSFANIGKTITIVENSITVPFDGNEYSVIVNSNITDINFILPDPPLCSVVQVYFLFFENPRAIPSPDIRWPEGIVPLIQTNINSSCHLIMWNDQFGTVYGEYAERKMGVV